MKPFVGDHISSPDVLQAIVEANAIVSCEDFLVVVSRLPVFDQSDGVDGTLVAKLMREWNEQVSIVPYWAPWYNYIQRKVNAYTKAVIYPTTIFFHMRNANRPLKKMRATIVHEWVHLLDNKDPHSFGHGGNSPLGKDHTAEYYIDSIVENWKF